MDVTEADSAEALLQRLLDDPKARARLGETIRTAKARGGDFLREIGIDPKQDAPFVGVGGVIATAIAAADLSDSSRRLEEANHRLEETNRELLSKTHELVAETKVLKVLTAILALLTAVLVWRTFFP